MRRVRFSSPAVSIGDNRSAAGNPLKIAPSGPSSEGSEEP